MLVQSRYNMKDTLLKEEQMKNKVVVLAVASFVILISGCAQTAESIKPAHVSPLTYEKYGCTQLKDEAIKVNNTLEHISVQQNEKAKNDAKSLGTYIITGGLYIQSMGVDQEESIVNLKGQSIAIKDVATKKNCDFVASMK